MDDIRIRRDLVNDRHVITLPDAEITVCSGRVVEVSMDTDMLLSLHYYLGLWIGAIGGGRDESGDDLP